MTAEIFDESWKNFYISLGICICPSQFLIFSIFWKFFKKFQFFPKMGSKMAIFGHFPIQILQFQQSGALWGVTALSWCAGLAKSENRSCSTNNLQQLSGTKFLLRRQSWFLTIFASCLPDKNQKICMGKSQNVRFTVLIFPIGRLGAWITRPWRWVGPPKKVAPTGVRKISAESENFPGRCENFAGGGPETRASGGGGAGGRSFWPRIGLKNGAEL